MHTILRATVLVLAICLMQVASGCNTASEKDENFPWISTLEPGKWPETLRSTPALWKNGGRLLKLKEGLHLLDHEITEGNDVLIAAHGWGARGFEWVYPLVTLDNENLDTYFLRWAYWRRAERAEQLLLDELDKMLGERKEPVKRVIIVAHSCGGVVSLSAVPSLPDDVEFDIHLVASPVNGLGIWTMWHCDADVPESLPENVNVTHWQTQFRRDKVFFYFPKNPQDIDLERVQVKMLPGMFKDKLLGHVRSLTWAAEQIAELYANPRAEESAIKQSETTESTDD